MRGELQSRVCFLHPSGPVASQQAGSSANSNGSRARVQTGGTRKSRDVLLQPSSTTIQMGS